MALNFFYTINKSGEGLFKEKGSKFISLALPVADLGEVQRALDEVKKEYYDARHHCFAYIVGTGINELVRANDDGEPNHSAGDPILGQIRSLQLTDTLVVVVRYFGGTKLGVGGLINAYRTAAAEALQSAGRKKVLLKDWYQIQYPYESTNEIMRLIKDLDLEVRDQNFTESCQIEAGVLIDRAPQFLSACELLINTGITLEFSKITK